MITVAAASGLQFPFFFKHTHTGSAAAVTSFFLVLLLHTHAHTRHDSGSVRQQGRKKGKVSTGYTCTYLHPRDRITSVQTPSKSRAPEIIGNRTEKNRNSWQKWRSAAAAAVQIDRREHGARAPPPHHTTRRLRSDDDDDHQPTRPRQHCWLALSLASGEPFIVDRTLYLLGLAKYPPARAYSKGSA